MIINVIHVLIIITSVATSSVLPSTTRITIDGLVMVSHNSVTIQAIHPVCHSCVVRSKELTCDGPFYVKSNLVLNGLKHIVLNINYKVFKQVNWNNVPLLNTTNMFCMVQSMHV